MSPLLKRLLLTVVIVSLLASLLAFPSLVPTTQASSDAAITYAREHWAWEWWDHSSYKGLIDVPKEGEPQDMFECAEFVARSLAAAGLLANFTAISTDQVYYGGVIYNSQSYNLNTVTGLYRLLIDSGLGVDIGNDPATAQVGDVSFYGIVDYYSKDNAHTALVTSKHSDNRFYTTGHNWAYNDSMPVDAYFKPLTHIVRINYAHAAIATSLASPGPIVLSAPAPYRGAIITRDAINPNLDISWNQVGGASGYHVKVWDVNGNVVVDTNVLDHFYSLHLYNFLRYGVYTYAVSVLPNNPLLLAATDTFNYEPDWCLTMELNKACHTYSGGASGSTIVPMPTTAPSADGIEVVSAPAVTVSPDGQFTPSITFHLTSGSINASTDFLQATPADDANKYGAWPTQGFTHNVSAGQTYTFDTNSTSLFHMTAPKQPGTYYSTWQLWIGGAFKGPKAVVQINVTGDPPAPVGWVSKYYNNPNLTGSPSWETVQDSDMFFRDWDINSPGGTINVDNWSATFEKSVSFDGGFYHFYTHHDDAAKVYVDGQEQYYLSHSGEGDWSQTLSPGSHTIRIEYHEYTGGARMELWWQGPGTDALPEYQNCDAAQWCAEYWGNKTNTGVPAVRVNEGDGNLARDWHNASPLYGLPADNFSARYTRAVYFSPAGIYRFHFGYDDGVKLYIDDTLKYDNGIQADADIPISYGYHVVRVDYREDTGAAFFNVAWQRISDLPPTATPTATPQGMQSTTLHAVEDTYAYSLEPTIAHGSEAGIVVEGQPATYGYFKFDLSSLAGATILDAKLRMYITSPSAATQSIHDMTTSWSEGSLTWNNKPSLNSTVATLSSNNVVNSWVEVGVTSSVQAHVGSLYALGIDATDPDAIMFNSRENPTNPEELVINYTGGATPTNTPPPAQSAQFVQGKLSNSTAAVASQTLTFDSSVTSGNLLVLGISGYAPGGAFTVSLSDNHGNTYTKAVEQNTGDFVAIWYAQNVTGGSNFVITITPSQDAYLAIGANEYSGMATTSVLDKTAGSIGTGTVGTSGNTATTVQANELLFGATFFDGAGPYTVTAGSGYTLRQSQSDNTYSEALWTEDQFVNTSGAYAATFSHNGSSDYKTVIATFKQSGSQSATPTPTLTPTNTPIATAQFVQGKLSNSTAAVSSRTVTFDSAVTTGNLLVLGITGYAPGGSFTLSVADNHSNTYTKAVGQGTNGLVEIWYAQNVTGGSNFIITVTPSQDAYLAIGANEYSNMATTSALDTTTGSTGTGTTATSGNTATTAQASELLFGATVLAGAGPYTVTAGSGYTLRQSQPDNTYSEDLWTEDKFVSATGAYAATFSYNSSTTYKTVIAAFKTR